MTDLLNSPVESIDAQPTTEAILVMAETTSPTDTPAVTTLTPEEVLARIAADFAVSVENEEPANEINLPTAIQKLECAETVLSGTRRAVHALREAALLRLLDNRKCGAEKERRVFEKYSSVLQAVNTRRTSRNQALAEIEMTVKTLEAEYESALALQAEMVQLLPTITPELLRKAVGYLLAISQKTPQKVGTMEAIVGFATAVRDLLEVWPLIESANDEELAPFFDKVKETGAALLAVEFSGDTRQYAKAAVLHSTAMWARVVGLHNWLNEASALEYRLHAAKAHLQEQSLIAEAEAADDEGLIQQAEAELLSRRAEFRIQNQTFEARPEFDGIRDVIAALEALANADTLLQLKDIEGTLCPYENILGEQIRARRAEVKQQTRELEQEGWRQAREHAMYLQAEGHLDVPGDNVLIAWPKSRLNGDKVAAGGPQVQVWNREADGQYRLVQVHRLAGSKWTVAHSKSPIMPLAQIAKTRDGSNVYRVTVSLTTAIQTHLPMDKGQTTMGAALRAAVKRSENGNKALSHKGSENKKGLGKPKPGLKLSRGQAKKAAFLVLAENEVERETV